MLLFFYCTLQLYATKFASIISKIQLLQTDHQLTRAVDDFSSMSNRAMVLYDDFLDTLNRALEAENRGASTSRLQGNGRSGYVNGSGFDGTVPYLQRSNDSGGGWETDLHRFRQSTSGRAYGDYPIELEDGSDSAYGNNGYRQPSGSLSPPKPTDSLNFHRSSIPSGRGSPGRYGRNTYDESPRTSYSNAPLGLLRHLRPHYPRAAQLAVQGGLEDVGQRHAPGQEGQGAGGQRRQLVLRGVSVHGKH
jgi:hypothetical protein